MGSEARDHHHDARITRAEQEDWDRHKRMFKEALTEWVRDNPKEGKKLIGEAIAAYIDSLVKTQLESVGTWTLRGLWALVLGALLYAWWKTTGWKV